MLARRLLILLAVLMGLTALAAGVAPRKQLPADDPTPQASVGKAVERPVVKTLSADEPSGKRIVVHTGRILELTVAGDVVDSVQIGDLQIVSMDPESPALFELYADVPGNYPITLVDAKRRLGVLEVRE